MSKSSPKLNWCVVKLGEDMNWWVSETSDPAHWDTDGLSVIDPRQISHLLELTDGLREYGFDPELFEGAFFKFAIDKADEDGSVRLVRSGDSVLESEDKLFCLPDILDEEKGSYADLITHLSKMRVKLLNDMIDFEQKLTVDEMEEEIREENNADFMEGRATHTFMELVRILEYVPDGFQIDEEDDEDKPSKGDDLDDDLPEIEDEDIEQDETMRWDEDEEKDDFDKEDEDKSDGDNDIDMNEKDDDER